MNPKLQAAVAIFKELGWENVTPENVLQLPLGTAEQKRTVLEGLKSGEWGEIGEVGKNAFGWISAVDVDEAKLALFAVRVGVNAQRAAQIAKSNYPEMLLAAIAGRGAKYASDFIGFACVSRRRWSEHGASAFGAVALRLVDRLNLDIPQSVEYMKDWSVYAAAAMGLNSRPYYEEKWLPTLDLLEKHFMGHVQTGVAVGAPATGPFGSVLPEGAKRGWLPRDKAVQMVFSALDASVRPGDRKVWLGALGKLGITDDELSERAQSLIPLLASGDAIVVSRLAVPLISKAEGPLLTEVLLASFSVTTKSARLLILKAAQGRPCPANVEELIPWLSILAGDKDRAVAAQAAKLIQQWGVGVEKTPDEETEVHGLWRKTPQVWQPPPFELGEVTPDALTELAALLVNQADAIHDVNGERFLALANAVALKDPEAARSALRGLGSFDQLLECVEFWVKGEQPNYGFDNRHITQDPLTARDYVVSLSLGRLPCLLSTPSRVDLSVSVPDLAARIALYGETATDALEADLFLAMTRLDAKTKTDQAIQALRGLDVPIVLQSGKKMPITAGQAVLAYLDDPVQEPAMLANKYGHWEQAAIQAPKSLSHFPNRLKKYDDISEQFSIFPHWGDCVLGGVAWDGEAYHHKGLVLRQAARRAMPLPRGASINILAAQRSHTPQAAEDAMLAVTEAWERGLLRPGVADVALLDWQTAPPFNLAALAAALDGISRDGMLSVVWPVLDRLIQASVKAPRLLAGTAEIAELALAFLPEVQAAAEKGLADKTALDLPGIRALAEKGGASKAVTAAKAIAAQLPAVQGAPAKEEFAKPAMDRPFEDVWPKRKKEVAQIEDGVTMTIGSAYPESPTTRFLFTLMLPGVSDSVFQVVIDGWIYALEGEGQTQAFAVTPDTKAFVGFDKGDDCEAWLHWDGERRAMAVSKHRNWVEGKNGQLRGIKPPPLTISLLTIVVGLLAQDGDAVHFAPHLLSKFIKRGQIDQNFVRRATQTLLQHPVVNPAKLVRSLEKDIRLLSDLWPILTESIKTAGASVKAGDPPPAWVNRILDSALRYAPYLTEAAKRGLMPEEDAKWHGLAEIASSKAKSTAVAKAKKLLEIVG